MSALYLYKRAPNLTTFASEKRETTRTVIKVKKIISNIQCCPAHLPPQIGCFTFFASRTEQSDMEKTSSPVPIMTSNALFRKIESISTGIAKKHPHKKGGAVRKIRGCCTFPQTHVAKCARHCKH